MNFKESRPIYLQIAERIMDEILQDVYGESDRIPSVREYASELEVNANTVARSFDYLQTREIIFNKRGIGYFVADGAKEAIRTLRKKEFVEESLPELFRKMALLDISIDDVNALYKQHCDNQRD